MWRSLGPLSSAAKMVIFAVYCFMEGVETPVILSAGRETSAATSQLRLREWWPGVR
jgi:hypothetical protein